MDVVVARLAVPDVRVCGLIHGLPEHRAARAEQPLAVPNI